jgi:YesN/AraC family two-component response regulator
MNGDCFIITEKYIDLYNAPLRHNDNYELHFIENGEGLKRVMGDSSEYIKNYELVLVCNDHLEYTWEQGNCNTPMIRDVTIVFSPLSISSQMIESKAFLSIKEMFKKAKQGICFPLSTIMRVYSQIDTIAAEDNRFSQYLKLLKLLNDLSNCEGMRMLSSVNALQMRVYSSDDKLVLVNNYIKQHFLEDIRLNTLAEMIGITPVSFSRFFKGKTGRNLSDYIIDLRLQYASSLLMESSLPISTICKKSGFNNLSNFNRLFKKNKGITPKYLRSYFKNQNIQ